MCNAHNHPPGCTCGWGGDGHIGSGGGGTGGALYSSALGAPSHFTALSSFTDPNARCPVCGAPVFFYRSPDGGRVFFDEIGPPWPKHPCTDSGAAYWSAPIWVGKIGTGPYSWQEDGWKPLFLVQIDEVSRGVFRVSSVGYTIMHFVCGDPRRIDPRPALVFFKARRAHISISMFSPSRGAVEFESIAWPVKAPSEVCLEKVRSNVYRFRADQPSTTGFFRSNCARLHKPQPVFCSVNGEMSRISLWWTDSEPKQFAFFDTVDEALVAKGMGL